MKVTNDQGIRKRHFFVKLYLKKYFKVIFIAEYTEITPLRTPNLDSIYRTRC